MLLLTAMNIAHLPNEILITVFEALASPADLLPVVQTCRHFYALAIRVLYRRIHWSNPLHYAMNAKFWDNCNPSVARVPISLFVGISHMHPNSFARFDPSSAIVEADGSWSFAYAPGSSHAGHGNDGVTARELNRMSFFATKALYGAMSDRIATFVMLRELVFHHADLPDIIYNMIKSLPHLSTLAIQYCTLPVVRTEPDTTLTELPLTELTLWYCKGESDSIPMSSYTYALHLCTARNLRVLKVDWTTVTARFFSGQKNWYSASPFAQPENLEEITFRMPSSKFWPSENEPSRNLLINPLIAFLKNAKKLSKLTFMNRLPPFEIPVEAIPNLQHYVGPLSTVLSFVKTRPVRHVEVTDLEKKFVDYVDLLPVLAVDRPNLLSLSLAMRDWDNEIMYAVTELFSELRHLKITYEDKYPSEYTLLSLGSHFLHRLPCLETLRIYQLSAPPSVPPDHFPPPHPQHYFLHHQQHLSTQLTDSTPLQAVSNSNYHNASLGSSDDESDEEIVTTVSRRVRINRPPCMRYQGPGASTNDDDVRDLIIPWKKHCKRLMEIQFAEGVVWRRAFDGDKWCRRTLDPADRWRELLG